MAPSFQAFRSLIDHSPDAISVIDPQGEILFGSASTTKIFGYRPEELVGRNWFDLMHPEDRAHSSWALRKVLATHGALQWEVRMLHKDGHDHWVESTASNLLFESEVRAIVMHQRDINACREAESVQQQLNEELARCNERLEEFVYTAAHDLREPLRAITAFTQLLVERIQMDANTRQMGQFILDGTARMARLIDDLLAFAATGAYEPPRSVDMESVVGQAIQNLALEIKESGARVTTARLPAVLGNEIHLVRLLQNLIGNAVKYRAGDSPQIHVTAEPAALGWMIRVQDNGVGIATEYQDRVFLPFVRLTKSDIPGTGLGLAVCKKIVDGLGGSIWVESAPGTGSTFCFTIAAPTAKPSVGSTLPAPAIEAA